MPLNNDNNNECCKCTTPEYIITLNEQGPQGRQGATGQNGFSPIIDVSTNTRDTYKLTITTADGVIVTPNLKSEPIPSGGSNGQVLINYGNDAYGWGDLPLATTENSGVVFLATDEGFQPDDEGNVNDTTAVTPQTVVDILADYQKTDTAVTTSDIATVDKLGIVKPDGATIAITPDGTLSTIGGITEIPQATATALGGIKANEKDGTDTQEVRIDPATGILYTKPGGGNITSINGGGAESADYITHYTVVGNPTISDDFALTNTNTNNYIDTGYTASGFNSIEISFDVLFTDFNSTYYFTGQLDSHNFTCPQLASGTDRTLNLACSYNGSSWLYLHNTDVVLELNTRYNLRVGWRNDTKKWYGFLTNVSTGEEINLGEVDCAQAPLFSYSLQICRDQHKPTYMQTGLTMYLDTFKITKNGQLDYQAVQIL